MFKKVTQVTFPDPQDIIINMMPMIMGEVPDEYSHYSDIINKCGLELGSTVYLTIHESLVEKGSTQRRGGCHTDATNTLGWGGSPWGGKQGIYLSSTDGRCRIWNEQTTKVDEMGHLTVPVSAETILKPSTLYWMGDTTPHEALPAENTGYRQFFRLVAKDIGGWWEEHSTPSPLGVKPKAPILRGSKFALS